MKMSLREGLGMIRRLPWTMAGIACYQLAWATALYMVFRSIVKPILLRLPDQSWHSLDMQILAAEAQFRLTKTDMAWPVLIFIGGLLLLRMMFTPLINAGLYHALHHQGEDGRPVRSFLDGCRRLGGSFAIVHIMFWVLALVPLGLAIRRIGEFMIPDLSPGMVLANLLTYAAYFVLLRLLKMYILFARSERTSWTAAASVFIRRSASIVAISAAVFGLYVLVYSAFGFASVAVTGMAGIGAYIVSHLLRVAFKLWELTAQHHHFRHHARTHG